MLSTKPIDTRNLTFRYSGTAEHYEYDRETEKRMTTQTRDQNTGYPVWKVRCVAVYRAAGEHGEITVTVPHPDAGNPERTRSNRWRLCPRRIPSAPPRPRPLRWIWIRTRTRTRPPRRRVPRRRCESLRPERSIAASPRPRPRRVA